MTFLFGGVLKRMSCVASTRHVMCMTLRELSRSSAIAQQDLEKVLEKLDEMNAKLERIERQQHAQTAFIKQAVNAWKFPETQLTITARFGGGSGPQHLEPPPAAGAA